MSNFIPRTDRYNCGDIHGDIATLDWYTKVYGNVPFNVPLPNCTTYAYGRTMEIYLQNNYDLSIRTASYNPYWWNANGSHFGDAYTWYNNPSNRWNKGAEAKLGAIACFDTDGSFQGGHVAIVEEINTDGTVNLSESAYGGYMFNYWTNVELIPGRKYAHVGNSTFLGYIYNPLEFNIINSLIYFLLLRKHRKKEVVYVTN